MSNDPRRWDYESTRLWHKTTDGKKWYKKTATKRREYQHKRFLKIRLAIIKLFGGKCKRCGFKDWRALQIDHVNGDGWKKKQVWTSLKQVRFAEKNKRKFQLLCANCNWIKKYENDENRRKK